MGSSDRRNKITLREALNMARCYAGGDTFSQISLETGRDPQIVSKHVRQTIRNALILYEAHLVVKKPEKYD